MAQELMVVEPFAVDGKMYARGDRISDPEIMQMVRDNFATHVVATVIINDATPGKEG